MPKQVTHAEQRERARHANGLSIHLDEYRSRLLRGGSGDRSRNSVSVSEIAA